MLSTRRSGDLGEPLPRKRLKTNTSDAFVNGGCSIGLPIQRSSTRRITTTDGMPSHDINSNLRRDGSAGDPTTIQRDLLIPKDHSSIQDTSTPTIISTLAAPRRPQMSGASKGRIACSPFLIDSEEEDAEVGLNAVYGFSQGSFHDKKHIQSIDRMGEAQTKENQRMESLRLRTIAESKKANCVSREETSLHSDNTVSASTFSTELPALYVQDCGATLQLTHQELDLRHDPQRLDNSGFDKYIIDPPGRRQLIQPSKMSAKSCGQGKIASFSTIASDASHTGRMVLGSENPRSASSSHEASTALEKCHNALHIGVSSDNVRTLVISECNKRYSDKVNALEVETLLTQSTPIATPDSNNHSMTLPGKDSGTNHSPRPSLEKSNFGVSTEKSNESTDRLKEEFRRFNDKVDKRYVVDGEHSIILQYGNDNAMPPTRQNAAEQPRDVQHLQMIRPKGLDANKIASNGPPSKVPEARKSRRISAHDVDEYTRANPKKTFNGQRHDTDSTDEPSASIDPCENYAWVAAKQRREADKLREAEANERTEEKRISEEREYGERQKREQERKETLLQRQEQWRKDHDAESERCAALAKLTVATNIESGKHQSSTGNSNSQEFSHKSNGSTDNSCPATKNAPAAAIAEAARRREERIRIQQARNERNRHARRLEAIETYKESDTKTNAPPYNEFRQVRSMPGTDHASKDAPEVLHTAPCDNSVSPSRDNADDELDICNPTTTPQPMSLNSRAGQAAIAHSGETPRQGKRIKKSHARQLGRIQVDDLKIIHWKDSGIPLAEMVGLYNRNFGVRKAEETLRRRYRVVKSAMQEIEIPSDLSCLAEAGSKEALDRLNELVQQKLATPLRVDNPQREPSVVQDKCTVTNEPVTSASTSPNSVEILKPPSEPGRPQLAGKTMNEEAFMHYLEAAAEEWGGDDDGLTDSGSDISIVEDMDHSHFVYYVVRRDLSTDQIDQDGIIDDIEWIVCGHEYENLHSANANAAKQVYRRHGPSDIPTEAKRTMQSEYDDGMALFQLTTEGYGMTQVRVQRRLQVMHNGFLPRSMDQRAPRSIYFVRTYLTKRADDDLFGEAEEFTTETSVDNTAFTALELANEHAIEKFVKLTFQSSSSNLKIRQIERQKLEQQYREQLREEGGARGFHAMAEVTDGELVVQVEEGKLEGPRNI